MDLGLDNIELLMEVETQPGRFYRDGGWSHSNRAMDTGRLVGYLLDITKKRCFLSAKSKKSELLFRMPEDDSDARISRQTLARMAAVRGTSETEVLHLAARRLADEILPLYEADDGPLTDQQMARIQAIAELPEQGETCSSLFFE